MFTGSTLLVYALGWLIGRWRNAPGAGHHAQQAFAASFANTGYMGIPIFIAAWGPDHVLPAIVATVSNSAVMMTLAVAAQEFVGKAGGSPVTKLDVAKALTRSP